jgi:tetratricopeptide (TPR) repeat protein
MDRTTPIRIDRGPVELVLRGLTTGDSTGHTAIAPIAPDATPPDDAGDADLAAGSTDRLPPFDVTEILDEPDAAPAGDGERTVVTALPFPLRARLTGRADALDRLLASFDRAVAERCLGFALVTGAAGLGKSRLVAELTRGVRTRRPDACVLVAGDDAEQPHGAIARLLAQRFDLVPGEPAADSQERIRAAVAALLPAPRQLEVTHLLAHLARVPIDDSPVIAALAGSPQEGSRRFLALRRFLAADAERRPLVLVVEDLERCGAETVNLLQYLAAGLGSAPVLLVATASDALTAVHPSFGDGEVAPDRIDLAPLPAGDAETVLRDLLRPLDRVPEALLAHAAVLGGSPRALHELVHWMLEAGTIVRGLGMTWKVEPARLASSVLPASREALVAARLAVMDPSERRTLEMAAAVGDTLWQDAVLAVHRAAAAGTDPDGPALDAIAATGDDGVAGRLAALVERGWLLEAPTSRLPGERELRFAYPDLRDAVTRATDDDARRRHHAAAARWLELLPDGGSADAQEEIARHLELADQRTAAASRYQRAADAARAAFRNDRAVALYQRALACVGDADVVTRLRIWHDLGSVHELTGDFDAALAAFERVQRLAWVAASRTQEAVAANRIGRVWRRKGDLKRALVALEHGHALFRACDDRRGVAGSLDDIGTTLALLGRTDDAFGHITAGLALRGKGGDPRSIAASLSNLGLLQKRRGQFAAAATCHREALELRRQVGDRGGLVVSLILLAQLDLERGEVAEARSGWTAALAEAEAIGALPLAAQALCHLGELAIAEGKLEEADRRLEHAAEIIDDIADRGLEAVARRLQAQVAIQAGREAPARELAQQALAIATQAGLPEEEALSLVTLGEVLSASLYDADRTEVVETPTSSPAEPYFRRAIELLRGLGSEAELAKARGAYGRFLVEHGQVGAGKDLLREALAVLTRLGTRHAADVERVLGSV